LVLDRLCIYRHPTLSYNAIGKHGPALDASVYRLSICGSNSQLHLQVSVRLLTIDTPKYIYDYEQRTTGC
jgi:hypothetical protein